MPLPQRWKRCATPNHQPLRYKGVSSNSDLAQIRVTRFLLSSWMRFAFAGKNRVRPLVLFPGQGHGRRNCIQLTPVLRRRPNAPDVPRLIQRDSHQPVIASCSQWNAVRHLGRRTRPTGELVEQNRQPRLQWLRKPHSASLRVYNQRMTLLVERNRRIQAGQAKGYLRANSSTSPLCFKRFRVRTHMHSLDCTSCPNRRLLAEAQAQNQSNHPTHVAPDASSGQPTSARPIHVSVSPNIPLPCHREVRDHVRSASPPRRGEFQRRTRPRLSQPAVT